LAYFRERGYDVILAASPEPELIAVGEQEQVTVKPVRIRRNISPIADILALLKLAWLCYRLRPDLVNASMPIAALLGCSKAATVSPSLWQRPAGKPAPVVPCRSSGAQ
jgi:hypothetical protein